MTFNGCAMQHFAKDHDAPHAHVIEHATSLNLADFLSLRPGHHSSPGFPTIFASPCPLFTDQHAHLSDVVVGIDMDGDVPDMHVGTNRVYCPHAVIDLIEALDVLYAAFRGMRAMAKF